MRPNKTIAFERTPIGQLLYDLAFTDNKPRTIARKHKIPVASVDRMRATDDMRDLRKKVKADRKADRRRKAGHD